MEFETKSVFTGVNKDKAYNSVITPIYPTSMFRFDAIGKSRGYDYTRSGNPTRAALEENIAALEGGAGCSATCTGMAAVTVVLFLCKPGDHIITGDDIYGGTYRLFRYVLEPQGYKFSYLNMRDVGKVKKAVTAQTKMIWIETPSNPLLNIIDLEANIAITRKHKLISVVDNTFLSPYFQRPIEFGADIVVHSTTKYINGHSDVVGGAIVYKTKELGEKIRYLVNALGVSESPFDAWLVLRGVKTLSPRMEAHQANALKIAQFLEKHPNVRKVYYPGLKSHPQQALIKKQMKGFGGMVSFELNTKKVSFEKFFSKMNLFNLAESLGGVESLIEPPWFMSHASMGEEALKASGMTKETIRISVGLETAKDLIKELEEALKG